MSACEKIAAHTVEDYVWAYVIVLTITVAQVIVRNVRHAREAIPTDAVVASCGVFPRLAPALANPPGKDFRCGPGNGIGPAYEVICKHVPS